MPIKNRFADLLPEITEWRRDLHEHPEILFATNRTAAIVADKLREFGCDEVVTGIARTGVVGIIRGKADTSGRTVGLRADMDALPIEEATGVPYASKTPGAMHACGHDGHTAMLLGAAKYLAETRNFDGTVAVIFQPAEEGGGGGQLMVDEGVFDRFAIDEVYGMHNQPNLDIGAFRIRPGAFYASADIFDITVTGQGGHAAKPHEVIDPILVASHIVVALQSIVARNLHPDDKCVVSITAFEPDNDAYNVIALTVTLRGTVRTMTPATRDLAEARLDQIARSTAQAFGATAEVAYTRKYPAMVNSETETDYAAAAARAVSGECDTDAKITMGGEDFACMLEVRPGAYIEVGNGPGAGVHHPEYNFNDEAIPHGCSYWATLVEQRLPAA